MAWMVCLFPDPWWCLECRVLFASTFPCCSVPLTYFVSLGEKSSLFMLKMINPIQTPCSLFKTFMKHAKNKSPFDQPTAVFFLPRRVQGLRWFHPSNGVGFSQEGAGAARSEAAGHGTNSVAPGPVQLRRWKWAEPKSLTRKKPCASSQPQAKPKKGTLYQRNQWRRRGSFLKCPFKPSPKRLPYQRRQLRRRLV